MILISICLELSTTRPTVNLHHSSILNNFYDLHHFIKLAPLKELCLINKLFSSSKGKFLLSRSIRVTQRQNSHRLREKKILQTRHTEEMCYIITEFQSPTEKYFNHQCSRLSSFILNYFLYSRSTCVTPRQNLFIGHSNSYRTVKLIKLYNKASVHKNSL